MSENSPALRVLVVDDESLIRWAIVETLTAAGYVVTEARDAFSAVRAVTSGVAAVDAVILDYRLPDSNDLNLLATIRRLSPASAVILMTAFGTPEIVGGALDLGAFQVIHKPFEMRDLEPLLLRACRPTPGHTRLM